MTAVAAGRSAALGLTAIVAGSLIGALAIGAASIGTAAAQTAAGDLPKGLVPLDTPPQTTSPLAPLATPKAPTVKAPGAPQAPVVPQAVAPAPVPTTPAPQAAAPGTPPPIGAAVPLKPATPAIVKPGDKVSTLPEKLSGEDIKARWFDGRPFTSTGPDGTAFKLVFTADGKSTRSPIGKKGHATAGFWRVIAEGYCSRWAGSPREKCFNVRTADDGVTTVRFGTQIAATWTR